MAMAAPKVLDTHHKALSINLEAAIFGSFAEIGAGQEVAHWFLKVGAASGTVAKTISAYDKEVSDDIYGVGSRYVSQERLEAMLDYEWKQLLVQLDKSRGAHTSFFSFVDTVAARNFPGTNYAHGWMGFRFQAEPHAPPNEVILHVNLLDPSNLQQQAAVGILGVNLIYASFHERMDPETFLKGLAHGVAPDRLEIDYIELRGPVFDGTKDRIWDNRAVHARLVLDGLSEGVVFPAGDLLPPTDVFHKKSVVLAPGTFEHVQLFHQDMMRCGIEELAKEPVNEGNNVLGLFCLSSLRVTEPEKISVEDVLQHIEALKKFGHGVLLIRDLELYKMSAFVKRFTPLPVRLVAGISVLVRAFADTYEQSVGSQLEQISLLFAQQTKVYAYPMPEPAVKCWLDDNRVTGWEWTTVNGWVTADQLRMSPPLGDLYRFVLASELLVPLQHGTVEQDNSSATGGS
jgi:hypothetical protein